MSIVHLADGWLLLDSLSVFDVLFLLVSIIGAWMLLVCWLGNVGLFMLVVRSVAVGWRWWVALIFGGVLFKLVLVVLSLTSVGRLCSMGRWSVAECCWLRVAVLSLGMWIVGVGWREWVSCVFMFLCVCVCV